MAALKLATKTSAKEFLKKRINKGWSAQEIADEANTRVQGFLPLNIRGLLIIKRTNIARWAQIFGLKLKAKRGVKPDEKN